MNLRPQQLRERMFRVRGVEVEDVGGVGVVMASLGIEA